MIKIKFSLIIVAFLVLTSCEQESKRDYNDIGVNSVDEIITTPTKAEDNQKSKKIDEIPQKYKIWKTNERTHTFDKGMPKIGTGYLYWYKKSQIIIIDEGIKSDYSGGELYDHKTELLIIDEKHLSKELSSGSLEIDRFEAHYPNDQVIWNLSLLHFPNGKYHFFINGGDMYWDYYLKDIEQ